MVSQLPKPMTPERVLRLAAQKGRFDASLRYRDDRLRGICAKLKREGYLSGGKRLGGALVYEITESGRKALSMAKEGN